MNIFHKVTLRTLQKNRVRTIVTIIGIMLSTSLITSVTTFFSSMQNCFIQNSIQNYGDWYGSISSEEEQNITEIKKDAEIKNSFSSENIGYSKLEKYSIKSRPYLFLMGADENFENSMHLRITSGKYPQNPTEILLPAKLNEITGVKYNLNDSITLSIGQRYLDGKILTQKTPYVVKQEDENKSVDLEEYIADTVKTFKVVGFFQRPGFESFSSPGYTAITNNSDKKLSVQSYNIYLKTAKPQKINTFLNSYLAAHKDSNLSAETNDQVLKFYGVTRYINVDAFFSSMILILSIIIITGSVMLIYNSFAISLSERTKQFGILSSVGGTKKQLRKSVLFEAFFVAMVGIPLGILLGITGIAITLSALKDKMSSIIYAIFDTNVPLTLHISMIAVIVAVLIAAVTVLFSAWLPAYRAGKITAIRAIRQNSDIKNSKKKIRTSLWQYKLWGFEGNLARKNFKRNKKRYRITVISLFVSIVLFISVSSFAEYVLDLSSKKYAVRQYDISYNVNGSDTIGDSTNDLLNEISAVDKVNSVTGMTYLGGYFDVSKDDVTKEYLSERTDTVNKKILPGNIILDIVDDTSFLQYLRTNNLDPEVYNNPEKPVFIAKNNITSFASGSGKTSTMKIFKSKQPAIKADIINRQKLSDSDDYKNEMMSFDLNIGLLTDHLIMESNSISDDNLHVLIPQSMTDILFQNHLNSYYETYFIKTDSHDEVYQQIKQLLTDRQLSASGLYDQTADNNQLRSLISIIQVFAYGFIALISLISIANVFNTISTSVLLRKREFAMLKSVGMTHKSFMRMMNFECIFYGIKSLFTGIPVAVLISYYIYMKVVDVYEIPFQIPWFAIIISIISVFLIVFVTMIYAMGKLKKENVIETLRNDNV